MNKPLLLLIVSSLPALVNAEAVTVHNFARAETDSYFHKSLAAFNADVGQLIHLREPVTPANQTVIRRTRTLFTLVSCWT